MSNNNQPLSKRSRRLLEEASRHLLYAGKGINQLSLDEYRRLSSTVCEMFPSVDMPTLLQGLRWLGMAAAHSLDKRGQP